MCGDGGNVAIRPKAFLRARGAVRGFYWTPSMDNERKGFLFAVAGAMTKDEACVHAKRNV